MVHSRSKVGETIRFEIIWPKPLFWTQNLLFAHNSLSVLLHSQSIPGLAGLANRASQIQQNLLSYINKANCPFTLCILQFICCETLDIPGAENKVWRNSRELIYHSSCASNSTCKWADYVKLKEIQRVNKPLENISCQSLPYSFFLYDAATAPARQEMLCPTSSANPKSSCTSWLPISYTGSKQLQKSCCPVRACCAPWADQVSFSKDDNVAKVKETARLAQVFPRCWNVDATQHA